MTAPLAVTFADSQADIPPELWDACLPPPLEGRWWYEALEGSNLSDQFTFRYALVREGDRPVGIAPLFVMPTSTSSTQKKSLKSRELSPNSWNCTNGAGWPNTRGWAEAAASRMERTCSISEP